jgi:hypothetical protein
VARTTRDIVVVADADVLVEPAVLHAAIDDVRLRGGWAVPFDREEWVDEMVTTLLTAAPASTDIAMPIGRPAENEAVAFGVVVLPRAAWEHVGGQDERFVGAGHEDQAFACALDTMWSPVRRLSGRLVHLHRERSTVDGSEQHDVRSRRILAQYDDASGHPDRMRRLVNGTWTLPDRGHSPMSGVRGGRSVPSLRICVVLYENDPAEVRRCVRGVAAAARYAQRLDRLGEVEIEIGDGSPHRVLSNSDVDALTRIALDHGVTSLRYRQLDAGHGSAGGNNCLASGATTELLMVLDPRTVAAPNMLVELAEPLVDQRVAITEPRQMPFEHPKPFDPNTGRTSWASGCGLMIRRDVFEAVSGYDEETFPLYCDDVDLSWRVRLAGFDIVHAGRAALFHDKRHDGDAVSPEPAETRAGRLPTALLAYRYGRPDVVELLLTTSANGHHSDAGIINVRAEFEQRAREGRLPAPLDGAARVADFVGFVPGGDRFGGVA